MLRLSFTERRRRTLALKVDRIDRLESRSTVTPIGATALGLGLFPVLGQIGTMLTQGNQARGGSAVPRGPAIGRQGQTKRLDPALLQPTGAAGLPIRIVPEGGGGQGSGGALPDVAETGDPQPVKPSGIEDGTSLIRSLGVGADPAVPPSGLSTPWHPAAQTGGGAALAPRGGSGNGAQAVTVAAVRGQVPMPQAASASTSAASGASASSGSAGAAASLLSTLGLNGSSGAAATAPAFAPRAAATVTGTTVSRNALAAALRGETGSPLSIVRGNTGPAFTLITLDYNDGSLLVPGADQLATPGGSVDLRAQVVDSATGTYTYSWATSGLTDATSISGASTYDLTFHWNTSISTAKAESTTLTVTDPNQSQVSQTYTFWVPAGSGSSTGGTTWNNQTLDPGLIRPDAPAIASDNVSVLTATGALETAINLPSVNPNVTPVSLNYDSLAANAMPIVVAEHALTSTPAKVSAQLTFNGTVGSTYYYNTSSLRPGDIMQIGQQANATALDTGSYPYTMTIVDSPGSSPTTFTYTGNATVENAAKDSTFSALGAGWTVSGLNKIIPATGGVILDVGGGSVLWFSGSFGSGGGTYTSPAGDFSTLVLNSNGTYTRTLTDGTVQTFNSSGFETVSVDRNGLRTTFAYSSNRLSSITDPFNEIVTFAYNGSNQLQSIKDAANRLTTFTMSGGDLTAVEYPDSNTWDYGYDSSGRMTSVTEPSSTGEPTKIVTVTYDSAERVGTISRPDSTTEEFSAAQEQGWTNTGTSSSPASPTLLAQVGSTYTDPLSNTTTYRPDWRGMGYTDQTVDAMGNIATQDRDSNGLATITVDPMNRITQDAYDSKGNVTKTTYPDLSTTTYGTYNSFAEPSTMTDQLGRITSYTYDSHGNLTVVEDPMDYVTTSTYSSTQPGMLTSQTAPAPAGQSSYTLYSYQYDSEDRQTTITDADNDVTVKVYSSAGQVTKVTGPNQNVTTYSLDAMNRETGMTDAAGSSIAGVTTNTYDAAGNEVTTTDPDGYTTTTTFDAMDRQGTVKNPDGGITTYVYDNDGRLHVLVDPVNNRTTFAYDALGRQTTLTSPSVNNSNGVTSTTQYDADGEVTSTTDADGRQITYSYDQIGRQTGESWVSATYTATYTYDAAGEETGAADPNSLLTMAYDHDGRLGTIVTSGPGTGQPTVTLTYGHDPSGDVTSITDSLSGTGATGQGITSYVYDSALRLGTITQSLGGTSVAELVDSYDSGGRLIEEFRFGSSRFTNVVTSYTYDAANHLLQVNNFIPVGNSITEVGDDTQTPDAAGRVLSQVYNNGNSTNSYTYDNSGQLTGSSGSFSATYTYDLNGNPNSTGYTTGAGNELTHSPGVTYTYDNDGNLISATTSSGTTTYTYDYENRLTVAIVNGTVVATYTYDALGRRVGIKDNGTQTWTVYNGPGADANPYDDFNGSGSVTMRYLDGLAVGEILARTDSSGNTAWYLTDELGSVTDIMSKSAATLDHIVYDPFGNIVTETNATNGDRFKFAGMQYDSATGLYYDHARYYDAAIGGS